MVLQGSKQLALATNLAVAGALDAKIVICSNTTFYNYLKESLAWGNSNDSIMLFPVKLLKNCQFVFVGI
ncbi:hypothetical protein D3C84_1010680 [compost metagenome]